ncbi:rab-GTPase-TBC domain protein (macronuclear) [Tetrahymena thermophila SB210]|uniref:Rab-GTPase-TBC domain protein n=1 Tax=Tetrahymena thermophila (strain SB210) TaxID=312017 RepID=I7MHV5_TETTS|nr:rab-GTPase-TBC domain protein [Tetrahymena thermophila SB210]EAS03642.2 rab-GTPase-TBC domain protein [Tetrahymena thermophila SB210]|eukprot:XP_001023887.2 rab-GTPase-TBC domain protein [Tetrahymena thermophila SB210]
MKAHLKQQQSSALQFNQFPMSKEGRDYTREIMQKEEISKQNYIILNPNSNQQKMFQNNYQDQIASMRSNKNINNGLNSETYMSPSRCQQLQTQFDKQKIYYQSPKQDQMQLQQYQYKKSINDGKFVQQTSDAYRMIPTGEYTSNRQMLDDNNLNHKKNQNFDTQLGQNNLKQQEFQQKFQVTNSIQQKFKAFEVSDNTNEKSGRQDIKETRQIQNRFENLNSLQDKFKIQLSQKTAANSQQPPQESFKMSPRNNLKDFNQKQVIKDLDKKQEFFNSQYQQHFNTKAYAVNQNNILKDSKQINLHNQDQTKPIAMHPIQLKNNFQPQTFQKQQIESVQNIQQPQSIGQQQYAQSQQNLDQIDQNKQLLINNPNQHLNDFKMNHLIFKNNNFSSQDHNKQAKCSNNNSHYNVQCTTPKQLNNKNQIQTIDSLNNIDFKISNNQQIDQQLERYEQAINKPQLINKIDIGKPIHKATKSIFNQSSLPNNIYNNQNERRSFHCNSNNEQNQDFQQQNNKNNQQKHSFNPSNNLNPQNKFESQQQISKEQNIQQTQNSSNIRQQDQKAIPYQIIQKNSQIYKNQQNDQQENSNEIQSKQNIFQQKLMYSPSQNSKISLTNTESQQQVTMYPENKQQRNGSFNQQGQNIANSHQQSLQQIQDNSKSTNKLRQASAEKPQIHLSSLNKIAPKNIGDQQGGGPNSHKYDINLNQVGNSQNKTTFQNLKFPQPSHFDRDSFKSKRGSVYSQTGRSDAGSVNNEIIKTQSNNHNNSNNNFDSLNYEKISMQNDKSNFFDQIKELSDNFFTKTQQFIQSNLKKINQRLGCSCDLNLKQDATCSKAYQWLFKQYKKEELEELKKTYNNLKNHHLPEMEPCMQQIEKDLQRTFPQLEMFQNEKHINSLRNLLQTVAKYDPIIGYVQGMNMIGASLLYHAEEYISFWIMQIIFEKLEMRDIYMPKLPGLSKHIQLIDFITLTRISDLYSHFCEQKITFDMFTTPWIFSLFGVVLTPQKLTILITELLEEGWLMFYKLVIAFLCYNKELLFQQDMGEMLVTLTQDNYKFDQQDQWEQLIKYAKNVNIDSNFINSMLDSYDPEKKQFIMKNR